MVSLGGKAGHGGRWGRQVFSHWAQMGKGLYPGLSLKYKVPPRSLLEGVACGKGNVSSSSPSQPIRKPMSYLHYGLPATISSGENSRWGEIVKKEVWDSGPGEGEGAGRLG